MMAEVVERHTRQAARKQVRATKGRAGVDGMSGDELPDVLKTHWPAIKAQVLAGTYQPQGSKRVEIPQPGSQEQRKLGMPCVIDRLSQQAMRQGLQGRGDPTFAACRYGFRPGRSAQQAVAQAQASLEQGARGVVDIAGEKCFDHVGHDRRMRRLAERLTERRLLKLMQGDLQAGSLEDGLVTRQEAGTPPGSPLSPCLSKVVLDEWDKELAARGHRCGRYADESHIDVHSMRAGERGMASISRVITGRLKWKVTESKCAVDRPQNRRFLGLSFAGGKSPQRRTIAPKALNRFTARVQERTRRNQGRSLGQVITALCQYLRGWMGTCGVCQTSQVLRDLDRWMRHRLRCLQWKQGKVYRRRKAALIKRRIKPEWAHTTAFSATGPWRISHTPGVRMALNTQFCDRMGLIRLRAHQRM
jgi:RNA-directed DNA polymerase